VQQGERGWWHKFASLFQEALVQVLEPAYLHPIAPRQMPVFYEKQLPAADPEQSPDSRQGFSFPRDWIFWIQVSVFPDAGGAISSSTGIGDSHSVIKFS